METCRIAFTGHRNKICDPSQLEELNGLYPNAVWVHGGAEGFDTQVSEFARAHGIKEEVILPDYKRYPGHVAPLRRNDLIIEGAEVLVACYDGRNGGGTFYTINKAGLADILVYYVAALDMPKKTAQAFLVSGSQRGAGSAN